MEMMAMLLRHAHSIDESPEDCQIGWAIQSVKQQVNKSHNAVGLSVDASKNNRQCILNEYQWYLRILTIRPDAQCRWKLHNFSYRPLR